MRGPNNMLWESIRTKINRKILFFFWEAGTGRLKDYQKGVLGVF
jgi:hypothetical protein